MSEKTEKGRWHVVTTVKKYKGDLTAEEIAAKGIKPYEVTKDEGNVLVNVGIAILEDKLIGAGSAQIYDNGHARLGVGTGSTAAAAGDTDLQTAGVWKAMDATYPSRATQVLTFQSTFASADANQAWNEWAIDNGSVAHVLLNHKAPVTLGTKSSGEAEMPQINLGSSGDSDDLVDVDFLR